MQYNTSQLQRKARLAAIVFFCLFAVGGMNPAAANPPKPLHKNSNIYVEQQLETFPNLRFINKEGKRIFLEESAGKLRLVHFWATWCAPCVRELPALDSLQQQYSDKLHIIALSEDAKGFEIITPFIEQKELHHLTFYWDKYSREFSKLRMRGLPTSFLIDKEGRLIATIQGESDWLGDDIKQLIESYSP